MRPEGGSSTARGSELVHGRWVGAVGCALPMDLTLTRFLRWGQLARKQTPHAEAPSAARASPQHWALDLSISRLRAPTGAFYPSLGLGTASQGNRERICSQKPPAKNPKCRLECLPRTRIKCSLIQYSPFSLIHFRSEGPGQLHPTPPHVARIHSSFAFCRHIFGTLFVALKPLDVWFLHWQPKEIR